MKTFFVELDPKESATIELTAHPVTEKEYECLLAEIADVLYSYFDEDPNHSKATLVGAMNERKNRHAK